MLGTKFSIRWLVKAWLEKTYLHMVLMPCDMKDRERYVSMSIYSRLHTTCRVYLRDVVHSD